MAFPRQDDQPPFRSKTMAGPQLKNRSGNAFGVSEPSAGQHFGGQNGLPSKQKPSVGVIFPEAAQTWTLHHFALLQGPEQSAPAVQPAFAAAFFFAAKAG
jgi:hypothetical protein